MGSIKKCVSLVAKFQKREQTHTHTSLPSRFIVDFLFSVFFSNHKKYKNHPALRGDGTDRNGECEAARLGETCIGKTNIIQVSNVLNPVDIPLY